MFAPAIGRASLTKGTILAGREVRLGRRRGPLAMLPFAGSAVIDAMSEREPATQQQGVTDLRQLGRADALLRITELSATAGYPNACEGYL